VSKEVWEELESKFKHVLHAPAVKVLQHDQKQAPSAAPSPMRTESVQNHDPSHEQQLVVFRNRNARNFQGETLITYLLATLMVATRTDRVSALLVGVPMSKDLLEHLLPKHIITHWLTKGWLREMRMDPDRLVLTKGGVDVCRGWIGLGKWRPQGGAHPIPEPRLESFRATILRGPEMRDTDQFERRVFF
jgi:hypothetical protein